MQDFPLTVTGILRHGTTWFSGRKVITKTPDGYREICFGELGTRVAQLAHGLRQLGVTNGRARRHVHVRTTRSTWRRTSPPRAWVRYCTR